MTYPFYVSALNHIIDQLKVNQYEKVMNEKDKAARKKRMQEENAKIQKNGLIAGADPFSETSEAELTDKEFKSHLIGAVKIPKIEVNIPLFDETNQRLLEKGATILQGSSFPTGKPDTHTLISAHSGLPNRKLFTDVEELTYGDIFVINVLGENLAFQIDKIEKVLPEDTSSLKIEKGKELATLITCTPYSINTHRLLVTGHGVPYTEAIRKQIEKAEQKNQLKERLIILSAALFVLIMLALLAQKIRGYLLRQRKFDLVIRRLDVSGKPVAGIVYTFHTKGGKQPIYRAGKKFGGRTNQKGQVKFREIASSVYTIKEKSAEQTLNIKLGFKQLRQKSLKVYRTNGENVKINVKILNDKKRYIVIIRQVKR